LFLAPPVGCNVASQGADTRASTGTVFALVPEGMCHFGILVLSVGVLSACGGSITHAGPEEDAGSKKSDSPPEPATRDTPDAAPAPDAPDAVSEGEAPGLATSLVPTDQRAGQRVPRRRVASPVVCSNERPPSDPLPPAIYIGPNGYAHQYCKSDEDCVDAGTNGRCSLYSTGCCTDTECSVDECFHDSDCPGITACDCRETAFHQEAKSANRCLPFGNCRVDADCGAGYCSPSKAPGCSNAAVVGLFCHRDEDECVDDEDCRGNASSVCSFDPVVQHWKCDFRTCYDG